MTAVSRNIYFDVLDNIVNKYNNTVHKTIKMKPIDVAPDSYVEYYEDSNEKDRKFEAGDRVKISIWKNILLKDILQIGQEKFLLLPKLRKHFRGLMLLVT